MSTNPADQRSEALRAILRSHFRAAGNLISDADIDKIAPLVLIRHRLECLELGNLARALLLLVDQGQIAEVRTNLQSHWDALTPETTEVALTYPLLLEIFKHSRSYTDASFTSALVMVDRAFPLNLDIE